MGEGRRVGGESVRVCSMRCVVEKICVCETSVYYRVLHSTTTTTTNPSRLPPLLSVSSPTSPFVQQPEAERRALLAHGN